MHLAERLSEADFILLVTRHERRVRGFVATLVARREDVDEVVQQAFLTAWKKLDQFGRVGETLDRDFVRWLCTIARYQALGYVRRHRGAPLVYDSELVDRLADVQLSGNLLLEERREALSNCIERLAAGHKELLRRYYRADESAAAIAEHDGVTRQAVFKRLRAIRETLLDCVKRRLRMSGAG